MMLCVGIVHPRAVQGDIFSKKPKTDLFKMARTFSLLSIVFLPSLLFAANPKRGFVADGCKGSSCLDSSLLTAAGWFYDYNANSPYAPSASDTFRFAPMAWCIDDINATVNSNTNRSFFLFGNEPNNAHNCNKSPEQMAQAYGSVYKAWPDSIYVSPATAGDGTQWYDQFFAACQSLYKTNCNIKYLATHDYSCDPPTTMAYLKSLNDRYHLPIWLTEFSCGDGADKRPTKDHIAFMTQIFPMLDAADYVFRYAWMSAEDSNGLRGLVANNQLTELGQLYNKL
jgi:hypothetical protein